MLPGAHLTDQEFAGRVRASLAFADLKIRARVADRMRMSVSSLNHWSRNVVPPDRRDALVRAIEDEGGLGRAFFDADFDRLDEIAAVTARAEDRFPGPPLPGTLGGDEGPERDSEAG